MDYHIKDMPLAEWQKTIDVNLTGTFLSISARPMSQSSDQ